MLALIAVAPLALAALPVQAQTPQPQDPEIAAIAAAAIDRGAYAEAEGTLQTELRIHPNRPELLLNLAAVYAKTGRQADARALYARVLGQRDVLMDLTGERTAGSHAIAQTGLRRIEVVQLSSMR
jgi:hypothetical protein